MKKITVLSMGYVRSFGARKLWYILRKVRTRRHMRRLSSRNGEAAQAPVAQEQSCSFSRDSGSF